MHEDLIDRAYEAAFFPELWPPILEEIGARSGSASGALQILKGGQSPLWTATDTVRDALGDYIARGQWRTCERPRAIAAQDLAGFVHTVDCLTPAQIARDPVVAILERIGLGAQLATLIPMPTGEMVGLTFERRLDQGRHPPDAVAMLDGLRPHLARAALIAARLGLERARAAVTTLEALGLPGAVLGPGGRALTTNGLLDRLPEVLPAAHGRLMLAHPPADALLREAVESAERAQASRSIPLPGAEERGPTIAHVMPVRGAAHDVFGGTTLLVVTPVGPDENVPNLTLLRGLFDLTAKEARLAAALASGRSLKEAAVAESLRLSTARSYLEAVLRKTGTHQQSQLVALLKGSRAADVP
ncbi:helix-turn-helix transcriptional regulator [Methylobacterium sp. Leaf118]|uniref:helix-turn-helix transcriptional regulator n=1 Tax=Methylobacterium sp. Leaf118 TaxID=2876562 RepID=UPI001E33B489|nr:helix-turn-helix transcriptional regulator [Methylobacterium sp. Leaf118]